MPSIESNKLIIVEQQRLLLGNVGSSVIPAYLLAMLMTLGLSRAEIRAPLIAWCLAVIASKSVCAIHAKYYLNNRLTPQNIDRIYFEILGLNILDAIAWAALALVTLSSASMIEFMLVNSVLAGIAGSSMSLLSPVLSVFITFIAVEFSIVAYKFWQLGHESYQILTFALIFYFSSLSLQARNSSNAALSAIKLRFENQELLGRLRLETDKALASHKDAVEANLAKSRFLAAASHDLRQPTHALGLFLEVLSKSSLQPNQIQMLESAKSVNAASSEMLNTLLDFSRIEAGVIDVQITHFSMQGLLHKLEKEFAPQAEVKGLVYRSIDTLLCVKSDPALIELILRNLISNAIRYTDSGGLLIGCRSRRDWVTVEVWDTGIGIHTSQQKEIFREFYQLGNSERDRRKGLGLGLAIVEGLVKSLNLNLQLRSQLGKGSVFRICMEKSNHSIQKTSPTALVDLTINRSQISLLIVDDDEAIREGMCQLLQKFGFRCHSVESKQEALTYVQENAINLIISDYRLRSSETGVDVIKEIRNHTTARLPAILITGDTDPERLRDAHHSGIHLLHKPVIPQIMFNAIIDELRNN